MDLQTEDKIGTLERLKGYHALAKETDKRGKKYLTWGDSKMQGRVQDIEFVISDENIKQPNHDRDERNPPIVKITTKIR